MALVGSKPKVVKVAMPFYNGLRMPGQMLLEQLQRFGIPGYELFVTRTESTIIPFTRCDMIDTPPGIPYDFLFFVDDDIGGCESDMWEIVTARVDGQEIRL